MQTQKERDQVADALRDTSETVVPTRLLRRGLADALIVGSIPKFDALVVRSHSLREEPWCFGSELLSLWELLSQVAGWGQRTMSPNVPLYLADPLSALIHRENNVQVRQYGDVYHTLTRHAHGFNPPEVRQLELPDVDLLADFQRDPRRLGFTTFDDLLANGLAAGAVVGGRLVSLAHTNALTANYGDIGVYTDDAWRGMGFATASASIVARGVQELGRMPVWSAREDNEASLHIVAKCGIAPCRRECLPQRILRLT